MYEAFYGLREKPFNLTPDPKFLFLSEKHKEAFAHLLYGIKNRSGFVMLSGEIGTGKTTICRNLLNQLDTHTEVALIFNPPLNPLELLKRINGEFGIDKSADTVLELTDTLNRHLLEAAAEGRSCVLIIDEAQNLAPSVLEQIRLLSNLETETEKLLQIILIGQPELADKLALHELRQLNQRITARYHLKELDQRETQQYIGYRLHAAGARRKVQFNKAAARVIFRKSGGTPRVINALSDRCLLIGYTKETHVITAAIARQAVREIRGAEKRSRRRSRKGQRRLNPMLAASAVALIIVIGAAATFLMRPVERLAREIGTFNAILTGDTTPAATPAESTVISTPKAEARAVDTPQEAATGSTPQEKVAALAERLRDETPVASRVIERVAPAPSAPSAEEQLREVFLDLDAAETRRAALAALLAAWNFPLSADYPGDEDVATLASFLSDHGLAHEYLEPALDQLLAINLPALVRVADDVDSRWLALMGVDDDGALTLTSGMGETLTLPRDVFLTRYATEAVVPWRDPSPGASVLLSGKSGALVDRFKAKLRGVGRLAAGNTSDVYDAATASAVSRLQAETGLVVDGMAGKQVRMVLSSWLPEIDTPAMGTAPVTLSKPQTARVSTVELPSAPTPEPAPAPNAAPAPEPEPPAAPVQAEAPMSAPPEPLRETAPPAEDPSVSPEEAPEPESAAESAPEEVSVALDSASESEAPAESDTADMEEAPDAPPVAEVTEGEASPTEGEQTESESPEPAASEGELVTVSDLDEPAPAPEGEGTVEGARPTVTDPVPGSAPLVPKNY